MSEIYIAERIRAHHRRRSRHLPASGRLRGDGTLTEYAVTALACLTAWQEEPQLLWRDSGKWALDRAVQTLLLPGGAFASRPGQQTVYAAANALMIAALAWGGQLLREPSYLSMARAARIFIKTRLVGEQGQLRHSWSGDGADREATAEDYGFYVLALMELYRVTSSRFYRREAMHLADQMAMRFSAADGGIKTE